MDMEGYSRNEEVCPRLLDLILQGKDWLINGNQQRELGPANLEDKKLQLRLAPPGEQEDEEEDSVKSSSHLSHNFFSTLSPQNPCSSTRGFLLEENSWINASQTSKVSNSSNNKALLLSSGWSPNQQYPQSLLPVIGKESLQQQQQSCSNRLAVVDLQKNAEKKPFSAKNTAVPNGSQKRTAPQVVGWPPIRSFRKNLATNNSSKLPPVNESQPVVPKKIECEKKVENGCKGLFVKINMDGVPIGRKVDLKAYDNYEKLCSAVDELFRGLLEAQRKPSAGKILKHEEGQKAITGLLDGSGEYTLVYEDNEGDRMLVGDVPWQMFTSTVKRLRVLKSSELSSLFLGSKQEKNLLDAGH